MTTTPPRIDPRLGAAALRAPAASMVDSRPQAILKLRPRNSFDYRVRYEPQPDVLYLVVGEKLSDMGDPILGEHISFLRLHLHYI